MVLCRWHPGMHVLTMHKLQTSKSFQTTNTFHYQLQRPQLQASSETEGKLLPAVGLETQKSYSYDTMVKTGTRQTFLFQKGEVERNKMVPNKTEIQQVTH